MSITELEVSLSKSQEDQLVANKFTKVEGSFTTDLGGNKIYLWYKAEAGVQPVTRIQFSYTDKMAGILQNAGYTKIYKNINPVKSEASIFLWYYKGDTGADVPMEDLHVSTGSSDEAQMIKSDWERLICDLKQDDGGNWVYLWVKRKVPMYISEIRGTSDWYSYSDLFQKGYTRMDDHTNKFTKKNRVYIWYLKTTDQTKAVGDLQLSADEEQGYTKVEVDLNTETGRKPMFLFYKKDVTEPIKGMGIITEQQRQLYEKAGVVTRKMYHCSSSTGSYTFFLYFQR